MPVKIYATRDSNGDPWAFDYVHEVEATQGIVAGIHQKLHHLDTLYLVIANLQRPYADMVVIQERGIGVIELKNHSGKITVSGNRYWMADGRLITAGQDYENPHQQVQVYAEQVRKKLWQFVAPKWLKQQGPDCPSLKLQTTVCFSHPTVDLAEIRRSRFDHQMPRNRPWESDFRITVPEDIPNWVAALRFETSTYEGSFEKDYRLNPDMMLRIAKDLLGSTEWAEISTLLHSGQPFGYLVRLEEEEERQTHNLVDDSSAIGRDPVANLIVVPERYGRVSRKHARVKRVIGKSAVRVLVEDMGSTHGTYVDGERVVREKVLADGAIITLGGRDPSDHVCHFRYVHGSTTSFRPIVTENGE